MAVTPEEQKNARRKAMLLLEHMDRTEKGLSDRLRQAGFSAEAVEDAMNYVRSYGYLNDDRYAENYISFLSHFYPSHQFYVLILSHFLHFVNCFRKIV